MIDLKLKVIQSKGWFDFGYCLIELTGTVVGGVRSIQILRRATADLGGLTGMNEGGLRFFFHTAPCWS